MTTRHSLPPSAAGGAPSHPVRAVVTARAHRFPIHAGDATASDDFVDDLGRTCVLLLEGSHHVARGGVIAARSALARGTSMKDVSTAIRSWLERNPGAGEAIAAITALRFSANGAWLEILGAGMPPILCLRPDGSQWLYPPGSGPIRAYCADRHPTDIVALKAESRLLAATRGMVGGVDAASMRLLAERLEVVPFAWIPPDATRVPDGRIAVVHRRSAKGTALLLIPPGARH